MHLRPGCWRDLCTLQLQGRNTGVTACERLAARATDHWPMLIFRREPIAKTKKNSGLFITMTLRSSWACSVEVRGLVFSWEAMNGQRKDMPLFQKILSEIYLDWIWPWDAASPGTPVGGERPRVVVAAGVVDTPMQLADDGDVPMDVRNCTAQCPGA